MRFPALWIWLAFLGTSLFLVFCAPSLAAPDSMAHDALLDKIQEQSFRFFHQEHEPANGLVRDSARNYEGGENNGPASIAATGFGLTLYPVAVERGWMSRMAARALTKRTLEFFLYQAPQEKGFFYHFLNPRTGERASRSEISPIDTAIFLAGALFAAEYFDDAEIRDLATKLYERVDFPWMMNQGDHFALAWTPETGFDKRRWDHFDESLLLYVLAIGSPTHPVPADSWNTILRPVGSYQHYRLIQMPPLFTHQYPHIWLDLRNKNDGLADYFQNSVNATLANRAFCMDQAVKVAGYGPAFWGLTASEGPAGYRAYGAPPGWAAFHDGTIAPTACGSSIVFTPELSLACLKNLYENHKGKLWGRYGFSDAINVEKNWTSDKVLAIDQGPLVLMIENYRTGLIWKTMGHSRVIQKAMERIGFREGTIPLPWPDPPVYHASVVPGGIRVDGLLGDWPNAEKIVLTPEAHRESGDFSGRQDLKAEIRFSWDKEFLYFMAKVNDKDIVAKRGGKNIWRDDLFEMFVDPEGKGFVWQSHGGFQIGFRPEKGDRPVTVWSWFQGEGDPSQGGNVLASGYSDEKGYILEGAIRWSFLGIIPETGKTVRLSPAIHEVDRKGLEGKLHWFFRNEEKYRRFVFGKVVLA